MQEDWQILVRRRGELLLMTLKKNSPGCVCCSTGIATYQNNSHSYNRYSPNNTTWTQDLNLNALYGETVYVMGIDIERKYILVKKSSNNEVWMYNPATNANVGKLWESTSDIGDSAYNSNAITYVESWGVAYGLIATKVGTNTPTYEAICSLDSDGNFIKGPYTNYLSPEVACDSAGSVYIAGPGPIATPMKYGIYIDDDIQDSFPAAGGFTIEFDENYSNSGGAGSARYRVSGLVHDGTNLYADITSYSNFRLPADQMDTNGICIIDTGAFDLQIEFQEIIGEFNDLFEQQQHLTYAAYNHLQDRFEGVSSHYLTTPLRFSWYGLEEGKFITHFDSANLSIISGINMGTLATGPALLEEVWDEL